MGVSGIVSSFALFSVHCIDRVDQFGLFFYRYCNFTHESPPERPCTLGALLKKRKRFFDISLLNGYRYHKIFNRFESPDTKSYKKVMKNKSKMLKIRKMVNS